LCVINHERNPTLFVFDVGHGRDGEVVGLDGHVQSLHALLHLESVLKKTSKEMLLIRLYNLAHRGSYPTK